MKKFRLLIVVVTFAVVGFFLAPTGVINPAKDGFYHALKPFSIVSTFIVNRTSYFFQNIFALGSMGSQNQKLIKENLELQSRLSILKEVQHENEILKQEMGFLQNKGEMKLTPANIIGRSMSGYLKTIVIDRGKNDGVKANQGVVSQGFLVGTIKTVYDHTSEIILITDSNSLVPVVLQDSRGTGLLRGGLGGLAVEDIPLNIPIKKGEQVVTSGLGGDVPLGIMVGNTQDVVSHEGEIFQKITVNSPIKIYFLEFVFVVGI